MIKWYGDNDDDLESKVANDMYAKEGGLTKVMEAACRQEAAKCNGTHHRGFALETRFHEANI